MKKLFCLLLTLFFIFGFVSCKAARGIKTVDESLLEELSRDFTSEEINKSEPSDITPMMWKVTDDDIDGVIWLFGSIHVGEEDIYPLPDRIMNAYESSDALAVECDVTADINPLEYASKFMYKDGSKIYMHIPGDLYDKAKAIVSEKYGMSFTIAYDNYCPAMWQMLIQEIYAEDCDLDASYGLDMFFLEDAHENDKQVLEIESSEFQLNMLSGFSEDLQEFMLSSTVYTKKDDYISDLYDLYEGWKYGDIEDYYEENNKVPEYLSDEYKILLDEYNKKLVTDRNTSMAQTATEYLEDDLNVFFVVGLLHMVGEDGIVQQLIDGGYSVEQVTY